MEALPLRTPPLYCITYAAVNNASMEWREQKHCMGNAQGVHMGLDCRPAGLHMDDYLYNTNLS
jgi:hypothetical protein